MTLPLLANGWGGVPGNAFPEVINYASQDAMYFFSRLAKRLIVDGLHGSKGRPGLNHGLQRFILHNDITCEHLAYLIFFLPSFISQMGATST